jgi:ArsR family transcriptional regulator
VKSKQEIASAARAGLRKRGAAVFKALGHPSRLLVVEALAEGERPVAELAALVGADMSTVSNHLAVLRHAGVVAPDRRGAQVFYRLARPCFRKVLGCLREIGEPPDW